MEGTIIIFHVFISVNLFFNAYPIAAELGDLVHFTVNHMRQFKDSETGAHTNNVEGIHSTLKKDGHQQFGRLPYLTADGDTYYLDLLVWRANASLNQVSFFKAFAKGLFFFWTKCPLDHWDRKIPVGVPVQEGDEEDDEDGMFGNNI